MSSYVEQNNYITITALRLVLSQDFEMLLSVLNVYILNIELINTIV